MVLRPAVFALTLRTRTSTTPTRLRRRSERGRRKIGLLNGHKSRLSGDGGKREKEKKTPHSLHPQFLPRSLLGAQRDANAGEEGRNERANGPPTSAE